MPTIAVTRWIVSPQSYTCYIADDIEDKNCVTGWKCPDETPYCLKSKKLKLKGVCVYVVSAGIFSILVRSLSVSELVTRNIYHFKLFLDSGNASRPRRAAETSCAVEPATSACCHLCCCLTSNMRGYSQQISRMH